ncbi:hypothetical protein D3C78_1606290 [compost metagenome]
MTLQHEDHGLDFVLGDAWVNLAHPFVERWRCGTNVRVTFRTSGQAHGRWIIEGFSMRVFRKECTKLWVVQGLRGNALFEQ